MTDARITLHPTLLHPKSFERVETHWGYILRPRPRGVFGDTVSRFVGGVLVLSSLGLWLVPEAILPTNGAGLQSLWGGFFAAFGALVYCFGLRGFDRETQVDLTAGELRFVRPAGRRWALTTKRVNFGLIEHPFVDTSKGQFAGLWIRTTNGARPVRLISGDEREVNLAHGRLERDLLPAELRVEMRLRAMEAERPKIRVAQRRVG